MKSLHSQTYSVKVDCPVMLYIYVDERKMNPNIRLLTLTLLVQEGDNF